MGAIFAGAAGAASLSLVLLLLGTGLGMSVITVKGFSQAIVQHLAKTIPPRSVAKTGPSNRVGKLFVDCLRNGHGATTAAAFFARARPGMDVSIPIAWDDLASLKSAAQWNVRTAREHLSFQTMDPWAGYWKRRQALAEPMERLGYQRRE